MKHGNFVGQGWLPFEASEIESIQKHLKKQLVNTFGEGFFSKFTHKVTSDSCVIMLEIRGWLAEPFNGRNGFNSTVKNCTAVHFFVTKDKKGYLEIRDEKDPYNIEKYKRDYENCPEFSYGCSLGVTGSERPYRARHWESIQNWSPYTYGTEVSDLTYSGKDLAGLKKAITPK
jgi:hypothetical protein